MLLRIKSFNLVSAEILVFTMAWMLFQMFFNDKILRRFWKVLQKKSGKVEFLLHINWHIKWHGLFKSMSLVSGPVQVCVCVCVIPGLRFFLSIYPSPFSYLNKPPCLPLSRSFIHAADLPVVLTRAGLLPRTSTSWRALRKRQSKSDRKSWRGKSFYVVRRSWRKCSLFSPEKTAI